jgi:hypothetical protein
MKMDHSIALSKLYPQIVVVRGDVAYDKDEKVVDYSKAAVQAEVDANAYKGQRAAAYPPITDYIDGIVKGDTVQVQAYIDACLAVKQEFPK